MSSINPADPIIVPEDGDIILRFTLYAMREDTPVDLLVSFHGRLQYPNRKATVVAGRIPKTIEYPVRVPRRPCHIPYLGRVNIAIDGNIHHSSDLNPVSVVRESDFLEYVVRDELRALGFVAERHGGREPDVKAHHKLFPEEIFDVQCTLESPYNAGKFGRDFSKFMHERGKWNFTRLLIVSFTTSITPDVIERMKRYIETPISVITFLDLRRLHSLYRQGHVEKKDVFLTLTRRGLIRLQEGPISAELKTQRILDIPFRIS